ncbi:MAG: flagellar export protein FliJ [Betaproteobacteria bacterium]
MEHSTALDSLIELARGERDSALSRFAASLSASRAVEERLALLVGYRGEYATRLASSVGAGLTAERLRAFLLFLDKLDLAIGQQEQAMKLQAEAHQLRQADWASRESRLQGFATLRDRRLSASARVSRRDERRGEDEHARRALMRLAEDR